MAQRGFRADFKATTSILARIWTGAWCQGKQRIGCRFVPHVMAVCIERIPAFQDTSAMSFATTGFGYIVGEHLICDVTPHA